MTRKNSSARKLGNHVYKVNLSQANGSYKDVVNHCRNLFTGWDIDDLENTAKDSDADDEWWEAKVSGGVWLFTLAIIEFEHSNLDQ